jgi:hypothetical protein
MEILSAGPVTALAAVLVVSLVLITVLKLRRASKAVNRILIEELIAEKDKAGIPRSGPAHRRTPAHRGPRTSPLRTLHLPTQPSGSVHRHAS